MREPARPFGKRNVPAESLNASRSARSPRSASTGTHSSASFTSDETRSDAVSKFTAALAQERQKTDDINVAHGPFIVPKSGRAALLAGLVAGCLHASFDLGTSITLGQQLGVITIAGQPLPIVALLLLDSLWAGGRASVLGLFFVRAILAHLGNTHIRAYALCGGFIALLYGVIVLALGFGRPETLLLSCVTGTAAGFFYRLFAGIKPA